MKRQGLFVIAFLFVLLAGAQAALLGPYKAQALGFFFVHEGGALSLSAELNSAKNGAAVVKILDHNEKEVFWEYVKFTGSKTISHDFGDNAPAGIYQMRISGKNYTVDPFASPTCQYGVYAPRCRVNFTTGKQFEDTYFLIPEGAKSLDWFMTGAGFKIIDGSGNVLAQNKGRGKIDVSGKVGEVFKFNCVSPKTEPYYAFGFGGMPVILCPDEETARKINGSIEKADDGTIYAHKFQLRIHNWVKTLKPEDFKVDIVDLRTLKDEFAALENRDGILGPWGIFTYINYQLEKQNLDPASKDYGKAIALTPMGVVNSLEAPFNPYTGKLDNRILIAALRPYLRMKESDTFAESSSDYCGGDALGYIGQVSAFYESAKSIKNKELRDLWYDAVKRMSDRFSMFRVSCDNQSSHFPLCYHMLYEAYGNEGYKKLAEDYIHEMSNPENDRFMKTGYQQEAYGPDATYQGLGQCLQAHYYRMSGNKEALEGCRIVHDFMSHSVVREPNGRLIGSSNFSHRTSGGWNVAQYGAGWSLLRGEIESAAVFDEPKFGSKPPKDEMMKDLSPKKSAYNAAVGYSMSSFSPYLKNVRYKSVPIKNPKLPHEKGEFVRNFNNEFLAVRKNNYYLYQYLNGTAPKWVASQRYKTIENPRLPTYIWTRLQGTSILWFEGYGAFITGVNWHGNTMHILRGDLPNGNVAYPDYWEYKAVVENETDVVAKGALFQGPGVTFERKTECLDDGVKFTVDVNFAEDIKFKRFIEQIPFLEDKPGFSMEYLIGGKWTDKPGKAGAVRFGGKVIVKFDKEYLCEVVPGMNNQGQSVGALQIRLGDEFKAGDKVKISYTIKAAE